MIVKVPNQRQFPASGGTQQRFDDLVKYLLEKFGHQQMADLLHARYDMESSHEHALPGFTDILTYTAGLSDADRSTTDTSPSGLSTTGSSTTGSSTTGSSTPDASPTDASTADRSTKTTSEPDKCEAVEVHGVAHLATAIPEMNAVARRNPRVTDPAFHFILSWPEHEAPSHAEVFDAARHALRALNLHEHQYVLAIHGNTDNLHCHIAVNRVHPVTFKSQHLPYFRRTLHKAARESEIKHGWSHDNGIYIVEIDSAGQKHIVKNPHVDKNNTYETHAPRVDLSPTGLSADGTRTPVTRTAATSRPVSSPWSDPDSLTNWLRTHVAPKLKSALPTMPDWQALHQFLSQYGLVLKDTGGGGMRLTATDASTGEVLDIAASKALRLLKRPLLEERWGLFHSPTDTLTVATLNRSTHHASEDFTDPDQFDRFGARPETAAARERLYDVRSEHVDADLGESAIELLLQGDASLHMDHTEADFDSSLRPGGDGRRRGQLTSSPTSPPPGRLPTGSSTTDTRPTTTHTTTGTFSPDRFTFGRSPRRDLLARAQRREERAQARLALRRRYHDYRAALADTKLAHDARLRTLRAAQRTESKTQTAAFRDARRLLKQRVPAGSADHTLTAALLAQQHARDRLALAAQHQAARTALAASNPPALAWRDWLLEQAQQGDQPALSALRGIIYQARRDAKLPASKIDVDLTKQDPEAADYLAVFARLREEEKRERAIRSGSALQVRPHECQPLLTMVRSMTYRVTGNGNVKFFDPAERHLFTDRGNRLTFDRALVTDDDLRLALLHAKEKFGNRLTLTGDDPVFTARMAKMADDLGLVVLNPELRPLIAEHRTQKASPAVASPSKTPWPITPPLDTPQPVPTPLPPSTPSTAPSAPTPALPPETATERIRQTILAEHPRATFITIHQDRAEPVIGRLVAVGPDAFAQRVGPNAYAIHPYPLPATIAQQDKNPIHIEYRHGRPVHVPAAPKPPRTRGGR